MAGNINKAYSWAISTCNAPNVGYSQAYRMQQTINGITYYDCSSFIWFALMAGGFDVVAANGGNTWAFTTYTMGAVLERLGFARINPMLEWLPGDVGVSSSHTEMVYKAGTGGGVCMGAHTANAALANQVSIGSSSGNADYVSTYTRFPEVWRFGDGGATGYGVSIYVIAAIAGNWWIESNINPGLPQQGGGDGYGLGQWSGGRRVNLMKWLGENGYSMDSPEGQLEFFIHENDWQGSFGGISSLEGFLQSTSTDIAMLTEAFMKCWERPGVPALDERIKRAKQCYDYINAHANDSSITKWWVTDFYLPEEQILNNAVMLFRYLSAGGGGGGTVGKEKHKMKVFQKIRYYR